METTLGAGRRAQTRRPLRERWRVTRHALCQRTKLGLIRALAHLLRPRDVRAAPVWSSRAHRVLYLRYDRIGDMVIATGVIREITAAQPTVTVDVLASTRNAGVLRDNPHVGAVITLDKSRPWTFVTALARIRRMRYDAVIDATVEAPSLTSMLLMALSRATHRVGVGGRANAAALTLPVAGIEGATHYLEQSAALLEAFRVPAGSTPQRGLEPIALASALRPEIHLSDLERRAGEARWSCVEDARTGGPGPHHRLVVNVSAGKDWCYWPVERYIALLRRIRERHPDMRMLIVGLPDDELRMVQIGSAAGVPVAHTPHFREMIAIVAACDLVLTPDTSVTHIAAAFEKPVLALFARGDGAMYGPYGTGGSTLSTPEPSLAGLELEPVARGLEELIAAADRAREPLDATVEAAGTSIRRAPQEAQCEGERRAEPARCGHPRR